MSSGGTRVLIVGGGIIGLSCAWYLRREGFEVTLIDRGKIGAACSHGNCGLVCPSHVLPLTEPGAFREALKSLLSRQPAFKVRFRADPALLSWMWKFSTRCNTKSMLTAAHPISALLGSAMAEYEKWISDEGFECQWDKQGLLFVYNTKQKLDGYEPTNQLLKEQFNEPAEKLSAKQTLALEPALKPTVAGSWYYQHDAHLRPDLLVETLRQRIEDMGVEIREDCAFESLAGRVSASAAISELGEIAMDHYVIACGAWAPKLNAQLGVKIPIEPGKGYSITTPRPEQCPRVPMIFPEHRVAVTPLRDAYRLGSIMEFVGWNDEISEQRLRLLTDGASKYLHTPVGSQVDERWYGWRPMTPDSVPIIGKCPGWTNVWLATGHNMLGLSMAPATGKLIAELLSGQTPHVPAEPYRLERL